jgi:D-alanyl-D-alanine carboxypeptidase (penicillin-binding protein 5/6)
MKKVLAAALIAAILCAPAYAVETLTGDAINIAVPSAILMEKTSGEIIYEKNSHEHMSPASVTKIMTLLLVMEEIEAGRLNWDDMVVCSSYAASMGGSQIWLEEGEQMAVSDMVKAVSVVSANDCAVALAEHISGTEEGFVSKMNQRAAELGMNDTYFVDCTGLTDDENHYTCAYDIAIMSRMLIKHEEIKQYTTIWMDSLRGGESQLTNTNKLVRFYNGATGLKTGHTDKAMYCLSATAERDGVEYIAVVMHAQSSDDRFESAKTLLNYAFANYKVVSLRSPEALAPIQVTLGLVNSVQPDYAGAESMLMEKTTIGELRYETILPQSIEAPVAAGDKIGELVVYSGDTEIARIELTASCDVERLTVFRIFSRLIGCLFGA